MRLRYLRVAGLPPLQDLRAVFRQEPLLNRTCAIRFVAGVNGTGKTRLLLALAEVCLYLERRDFPPFPITLAYDIGPGRDARTVLFYSPNGGPAGSVLKKFATVIEDRTEEEWEDLARIESQQSLPSPTPRVDRFANGDLPGEGSIYAYLPSVLLVYTSGALAPWEGLFAPPLSQQVVAALPELAEGEQDTGDEAPADWDWRRENERRRVEFIDRLRQRLQGEAEVRLTQQEFPEVLGPPAAEYLESPSLIGRLVTPQLLRFAICSVALHHLATELKAYATPEALEQAIRHDLSEARPQAGLRGLLNEIGWLWPPSLHLTMSVDHPAVQAKARPWWQQMFRLATAATRRPPPAGEQLLSFDLTSRVRDDAGERSLAAALCEHLALGEAGPYGTFDRLCTLHAEGRLLDATLTVKKQGVKDLLLYDWLSDGERMFLGRIALFHLLRGMDDALILLDEPETHFNDVWKRRIVDIIDDSLRDNASEVVISTHSSIALTDVFDTEITLVRKSPDDASSVVVRIPMQTFGASPSDVMRGIFDAPDTVGQRASEFLDMILMAASYPDELREVWAADDGTDSVKRSEAFQLLWAAVKELPHVYEDDTRLLRALRSVRDCAQKPAGQQDVSVAEALESLEEHLGPGYYQFEFRRRLRALRKGSSGAASSQTPGVR